MQQHQPLAGKTTAAATVALALALMTATLGLAAPSAKAEPSGLNNWFLAPSLVQLRAEIDRLWPARSRVSDGWIGDRRHEKAPSHHNPVGHRNGPGYGTLGAVHALDITASGIDTSRVLNAVIGDSRVGYVIHGGRIWSAARGWAPKSAYGDPHNHHIHISLRGGSAATARASERNTRSWLSGGHSAVNTSAPKKSKKPGRKTAGVATYRLGSRGSHITEIQRRLHSWGFLSSSPTGRFGKQTRKAVRKFQKALGWHGRRADGIPGKGTLKQLGVR